SLGARRAAVLLGSDEYSRGGEKRPSASKLAPAWLFDRDDEPIFWAAPLHLPRTSRFLIEEKERIQVLRRIKSKPTRLVALYAWHGVERGSKSRSRLRAPLHLRNLACPDVEQQKHVDVWGSE